MHRAVLASVALWAWASSTASSLPATVPAVEAPSPALSAPTDPRRAPGSAWTLPKAIAEALARAQVPASSLALWVQPVDAPAPAWGLNADAGMNPASVFKLATTAAAFDLLGPAWTWKTPVLFTGPVRNGVLKGSLVIRGSGDPSLVLERVWLLLRQVRAAGVREIRGDIVLDHGAFAPLARSPADFDGAPAEPYNVLPDALLLNYKSVTLGFAPDPAGRVARVVADPPLAGVAADATLPLVRGACDDWRTKLKLATDDPTGWHFGAGYPASCGARTWPVAFADPASYDARMIESMWGEVGGKLKGRVRDGDSPPDATLAFEAVSPALVDVVRDINKYSNNVMAEQVFLTLGAQAGIAAPAAAGPTPDTGAALPAPAPSGVTADQARAALAQWLHTRLGPVADDIVIANGSGLARETRISARALASLLQWIWRSPVMPELMSSLPLNGIDGTLRHSGALPGRAHLKTGSMRDVIAIAGYVLADSGRRYVLVAIVNEARAAAARPALDAAIDWVAHDPAVDPGATSAGANTAR